MSFEITSERVANVLILNVSGRLLIGQELRSASVHVRSAGDATSILVDLSKCTRVDSGGLGELLMWYSLAARAGQKFLVCGASESIRLLLQMARVDSILLLARDREAALTELSRG